MKYVAVTLKGIEDLASGEIKSAFKSNPEKIADGRLLFNAKSIDEFSPRLMGRIYSFIGYFSFSSLKDLINKSSKLDFSFKGSFVVRCSREGSHEFDSRMIERDVGEVIFNKGFKVDLKNPNNVVVVDIIHDKCFLGILLKDNLCKRPYRIKVFSSSINACLAAAAIKFGGAKKTDVFLDPFCKDGVIPIEVSLLGFKNVFACDEAMNNIRSAKINAKLAGAKIKFSKSNVDSLDLKFDSESINRIVAYPPFLSKRKKQSVIENVYKEFFFQVRSILKKTGTVTLISQKPELLEKFAKRSGFKIVKERNVFVSNNNYKIMIFKKI